MIGILHYTLNVWSRGKQVCFPRESCPQQNCDLAKSLNFALTIYTPDTFKHSFSNVINSFSTLRLSRTPQDFYPSCKSYFKAKAQKCHRQILWLSVQYFYIIFQHALYVFVLILLFNVYNNSYYQYMDKICTFSTLVLWLRKPT